jgi:hypothetical protein
MNASTHSFPPEELMAYLDGELGTTEAAQFAAHLEECAECAALASKLRATSLALAAWTVEPAPASIGAAVERHHNPSQKERMNQKAGGVAAWSWWTSRSRAVAICGLLLVAVLIASLERRLHRSLSSETALPRTEMAPKSIRPSGGGQADGYVASEDRSTAATSFLLRELEEQGASSLGTAMKDDAAPAANSSEAQPIGPMIARSVSLTLEVKDCAGARSTFDAIVARHHGYAAQLTLSTPTGAPATFSASLRIPVPELPAALAEIRSVGRVLEETQSGEEVTPQHTDLLARLRNARETEDRLRQLFATHAGKVEDLLQVEEQLGEVRGKIESMEAELRNLEHRVDFATVDLDCSEQYHERLGSPQSASAGTQIANGFVAGLRRAVATLLGVVLFIEEFGPSILIWVLLLGVPVFLLARRYRRLRARV